MKLFLLAAIIAGSLAALDAALWLIAGGTLSGVPWSWTSAIVAYLALSPGIVALLYVASVVRGRP